MSFYIVLIVIPLLLGLIAQWSVSSAFKRYSRIRASSNMTGAQTALAILNAAGIRDVEVVEINGWLGDHYDPTSKRLCLSSETYGTPSLAAVGIAAHETGHAIQHAKAYLPLQARMAVVPATQLVSQVLPMIMFASFFVPLIPFVIAVKIAAVCYLVLTIFQLITLPVEFDASRRAKIILGNMGIVQSREEAAGVSRMLNAAALTYVAAFVASLASFLYFFLASRRNN
jgi:uncharacterized protein